MTKKKVAEYLYKGQLLGKYLAYELSKIGDDLKISREIMPTIKRDLLYIVGNHLKTNNLLDEEFDEESDKESCEKADGENADGEEADSESDEDLEKSDQKIINLQLRIENLESELSLKPDALLNFVECVTLDGLPINLKPGHHSMIPLKCLAHYKDCKDPRTQCKSCPEGKSCTSGGTHFCVTCFVADCPKVLAVHNHRVHRKAY